MLTNRDYFWLCCTTLTDESRFNINANVRRVVETEPFFLDNTEQAAFIIERILEIAQILTQFNSGVFNEVRDHLYKKLNIVRCRPGVCDCVRFKDTLAFDDCIDRLKMINEKIQYGKVISTSQKRLKLIR